MFTTLLHIYLYALIREEVILGGKSSIWLVFNLGGAKPSDLAYYAARKDKVS